MPLTPQEIESQALELPANDRAELAERLAGSLSDDAGSPSRQAWLKLARKRRDEIRSGSVTGIPGEEGSALVRKLVGRLSTSIMPRHRLNTLMPRCITRSGRPD